MTYIWYNIYDMIITMERSWEYADVANWHRLGFM